MAVDLTALKAKLEELKTGRKFSGEGLDKFLRIEDGTTVVRILPGKDDEPFYAETALHRLNGKNLHCIGRQQCPICRYVSKLYDSKMDENVDLARQIKAKKRFYFNVIAREYKDPVTGEVEENIGPKIFSCGIKLFEKILGTFVDADYGDLTDIAEGWDYKIIRKRKDGYPNYDDSQPRPKPCPASQDTEEVKKWLDELHDLQALVVHKTQDELQEELESFLNGEEGPSVPEPASTTTRETDSGSPSKEESIDSTSSDEDDDDGDSDEFIEELRKLKEQRG